MPHNLIVGMTESGKSTLAKIIAKGMRARGHKVAVLDPLKAKDWSADFLTADSDEFLRFAKSCTKHVLMIDEGSQAIGRYNVPMEWLATQSRHWGHNAYFLLQSRIQLMPIIRDNCADCYLFACSLKEAKHAADSYREPALNDLGKFKPGEFFKLSRFADTLRGQVNFAKKTVTLSPLKKRAA